MQLVAMYVWRFCVPFCKKFSNLLGLEGSSFDLFVASMHMVSSTLTCDTYTYFVIYYTQVGDAKEPVRKGVRALFRELCSFYPPGKLFTFVLDGLKSKNARQRTGE